MFYYSPILCAPNIEIVPAWFLGEEDLSQKVICKMSRDELIKIYRSKDPVPFEYLYDYSNNNGVDYFLKNCHMLFFTSDYVNTFAIIVSVFIVVLVLV